MIFRLVVVLTAALALAGCGTPSGTGSVPFDLQFIDMMAPHHKGAVAMAQVALERAEHEEIKAMARDITQSQDQEIKVMEGWRAEWYGSGQTPPMEKMGMVEGQDHSKMGDMTAGVEKLKTATPFDKAFIDEMIPHHESAIDGARIALTKAEHPEVKKLAGEIIAAQEKEIAQMKRWRAEWYP